MISDDYNDIELLKTLSMKSIYSLVILLFITTLSFGQTNWIGAIDSNWSNPQNWTAGLPEKGELVKIFVSDNDPVVFNELTIDFKLQNFATIILNANVQNISSVQNMEGGVIINNAIFTNSAKAVFINSAGKILNNSCATFNQFSASSIESPGESSFENNGIIYQDERAGLINITEGSGLVLNNVNDHPEPISKSQDIIIVLDENGEASIEPLDIENNSQAGYCTINSRSINLNTFTCADIGANEVELTVTDALGFSSHSTSIVTVVDGVAPVINNCPSDIIVNLREGEYEAVVNFNDLTADDICGTSISRKDNSKLKSGDAFPIGTTRIEYQVTDGSNISICSFDIIVKKYIKPFSIQNTNEVSWDRKRLLEKKRDSIAPEFLSDCVDQFFCSYEASCQDAFIDLKVIAKDDITVRQNLEYSYEIDLGNDGSVNYKGTSSSASSSYPLGTHKVSWIVKDDSGNINNCDYLFTIADCKSPESYCINGKAITLDSGTNNVKVNARDFNLGSFDNCTIDKFLMVSPSLGAGQILPPASATQAHVFECKDVGTQSVDFWVSDIFGNWDYCTTYVVVMENQNNCPTFKEIEQADSNSEKQVKQNVKEELKMYPNFPNPFVDETLIRFELTEETLADLVIQDISGRVLKNKEVVGVSGLNEVLISKKDLNGAGIYFYTIKTKTQSISQRMVLLEK